MKTRYASTHFAIGLLIGLTAWLTSYAANAQAESTPPAARRGLMNPDISANALMLYTNSSRGNMTNSDEQNGASLQEAEIQLLSDVDPYTKLNAVFSVHQDPATGTARTGEWKLEPEELFVESISLPGITLRGGKFKAAFGKHNQTHTHAFPFVDQPLVNTAFFGDEGLNDVGVSAAYLLPTAWYSEITAQILSGKTEIESSFNSRSTNDNLYLAHFKNLVELNDDVTAELGLSDVYGANQQLDVTLPPQSGSTNIYGADLTFKWRPADGGKYHALIWSTEYMNRQAVRPNATNTGFGYASWVQYQFAQRWWVQARAEYVDQNEGDATAAMPGQRYQRKHSALIGFFPSEFSGARLQYSRMNDDRDMPEDKIYLQLNFTIGAHPAHSY